MVSKIKNVTKALTRAKCYPVPNEIIPGLSWEQFETLSHQKRINLYLKSAQHIQEIEHYIPKKYKEQKKHVIADNLYLVDSRIAKDIAYRVLPFIKDKNQLVCETNAGLGFLTSELLDGGLQWVRLYETCPEFRLTLKGFSEAYTGKVELFVKDLFHIWKMSYMDKFDRGYRVSEFLKGVPKRDWSEAPVMTIIGTMSKLDFFKYLLKMISIQSEIGIYGRTELFVIMRPADYLKLTAGPHCDLHTYQQVSVFANVFCRFRLLEKYPRMAFLPWESAANLGPKTQFFTRYERDKLYLVHIEFKKELPLTTDQFLGFYFFIKQAFGRGTTPVVQKAEKWISGIGERILLPQEPIPFQDIDIFTKSGQLEPLELLEVFKILYKHPAYRNSTLTATIEAELLKSETVETDLIEIPKISSQ